MFRRHRTVKITASFALLFFCLATIWVPTVLCSQGGETAEQMKLRAAALMKEQKYTEALPILERLAVIEPNSAETSFYLGFALIGKANNTKDQGARKALRIRARSAFIRSKELGIEEPVVDALIQNTPPDGSEGEPFSGNAQANKLMTEGEALFSKGKLEEALAAYQRALRLDPKLYEAALFCGDVYKQRSDFVNAEAWYQKAIAIDPDREIAYRYSATPLMKEGKYDLARGRYIEAYISEPYNRFSIAGLSQWAQLTKTPLAHPKIDIPTNIAFEESGDKAKVDLESSTLSSNDGSWAWISYGFTRAMWRREKFAKAFPHERAYRHSLAEEVDALRRVIKLATGSRKVKILSPSIAKLKKLDDEGLLEAYVLLARSDQGIAADYPEYRRQNRDKLRRYVVEYVVVGGGP